MLYEVITSAIPLLFTNMIFSFWDMVIDRKGIKNESSWLFSISLRGIEIFTKVPEINFLSLLSKLVITSYSIHYTKLYEDNNQTKKDLVEEYDVLVLGYHRLGWKICESLREMKISFAVVDFDPSAIEKMKQRNIPYFFGDRNNFV